MSKEKLLYKSIESFTKKHFSCIKTKIQAGTKIGRIDVAGIRLGPGDLADNTEIVAVEVKDDYAPFLTSIGQAFGYSLYANRCYLAQKRINNFNYEEIDIASQLGVGLIWIKNKKIRLIRDSNIFQPKEKRLLEIASKLDFFRCNICRNMYPIKNISEINPVSDIKFGKYQGNLKRALKANSNLTYYLYELDRLKKGSRAYVYDKRYICKDCISIFMPLLNSEE